MAEETNSAVLAPPSDEEENLPLVALTPWEMPEAQRKLADWCGRKIERVQRELALFVALEEEAVEGGFKHASYTAAVARTKKRIVYYEKIKAAVDAGYLIVPNMPTRTFAVRVNRKKPRREVSSSTRSSAFDAKPDLLPAGEGRYVDDRVYSESETYTGKDYHGKDAQRVRYFSTEFDEDVDFPLQGVMLEVLKATSHAMSLRLFDQLGIVRNDGTGRDPIVVGQLFDPGKRGQLVTFFIAWWLNTETL